MKKLLLTLMLAIVSSSVMAEWVEISRNEDFGITVYADPANTRKSGNEVKMWVLVDYKSAQGNASK